MARSDQTLLNTLRAELKFLEAGGYRRSSWHPQLFFEDSPTCLNYKDPTHSKPCLECPLMKLVPKEHCHEQSPCRYIPLNARGETIDSLYRAANVGEVEDAVRNWLKREIRILESASA